MKPELRRNHLAYGRVELYLNDRLIACGDLEAIDAVERLLSIGRTYAW